MVRTNEVLQQRRTEARVAENIRRTELTKEATDKEVLIETFIREQYTLSQEIALLRKVHLGKVTEEEFKAYSDYVESCIKRAEDEVTTAE